MGKLFSGLFGRIIGNPKSSAEGVAITAGTVLTTTGEPITTGIGVAVLGILALKRVLDKDHKPKKEEKDERRDSE